MNFLGPGDSAQRACVGRNKSGNYSGFDGIEVSPDEA